MGFFQSFDLSKLVIILSSIVFFGFFASCQNSGKLALLADLPSSLSENSGIASFDGKTVWLIEDSGNNDNIFKVGLDGKTIKHLDLKNANNHDWEDLTKDTNGNLYIGDFGNNQNKRQNLTIYKLPNPELEKGDKIKAEKIEFHYPEQKEFPPKKSNLYYDTEAFFHWGNSLYIITKNRTRPYDGTAMIYKVPDTKGKYKAEFVSEWFTCDDQNACSVTSADISPDGKIIAVLGYGTLWLITNFGFDDFYKGTIRQIDLGMRTQLEALCFLNKNTLLISDEKSPRGGNNLYRLDLEKALKSEPKTKREP